MKFSVDMHGPHRMNATGLGDILTFYLVPPKS